MNVCRMFVEQNDEAEHQVRGDDEAEARSIRTTVRQELLDLFAISSEYSYNL